MLSGNEVVEGKGQGCAAKRLCNLLREKARGEVIVGRKRLFGTCCRALTGTFYRPLMVCGLLVEADMRSVCKRS